MSVEPPSSGRPTGPPSGPLSGPSQPPTGSYEPPSGPPSQPPGTGGGDGGGGAPEPGRPWWKSVPRVAVATAAVVVAVVLAVVLTRPGGSGGKEVFMQSAAKTGPDPFTASTAKDSSAPPVSASPATGAPANAVRSVDGGAPGLYGGTRNVSSCDVEKQIKALNAAPAKNKAFASVAGVAPSAVPAYLRSLTPVQLRMDTRVTNHGYRDGAATSYQAVLQHGTAVLVDSRGVPRVRCACGNPLTPPVAQQSTRRTGDSWPSYSSSNVVVVRPAPHAVKEFVLYDPEHREWIARPRGDTGGTDHKTKPPAHKPSPCVSPSGGTRTPSTPSTPCPPSSHKPPPPPPSSESPSSKPPSSESPSSEPPSSKPPSSPPAPEPPTSGPESPPAPVSSPAAPPTSA